MRPDEILTPMPAHCCISVVTSELRWVVRGKDSLLSRVHNVLQQAHVCRDCGKKVWLDVPLHKGDQDAT